MSLLFQPLSVGRDANDQGDSTQPWRRTPHPSRAREDVKGQEGAGCTMSVALLHRFMCIPPRLGPSPRLIPLETVSPLYGQDHFHIIFSSSYTACLDLYIYFPLFPVNA